MTYADPTYADPTAAAASVRDCAGWEADEWSDWELDAADGDGWEYDEEWTSPRWRTALASLRSPHRVLLAFALLVAMASVAGLATFATFTSTSSASNQITTGTVTVALGATGGVSNRLNVNATNIAPGDTMQRTVDLVNSSSMALASDTLTTTAPTSSVLDTDTTNGLQLTIDRCSVPWTEAGSSPAYTYTCSGSTTSVLASRAIIGTNLALSNMTLTAGPATDHLRVTMTLPSTAGNSFQGVTSNITFAFTGTQRAATNS
jgi:predicted ribosomally synthesized peptide with SipW-like signal peptide